MSILNNMDISQGTKEEYNQEPVCYCASCLSLNILNYSGTGVVSYCGNCTSTDIVEGASIEDWNNLYELKYGHKFIEEKKINN